MFLSTARIAVKENGKQKNKTEDDCKDVRILHRCFVQCSSVSSEDKSEKESVRKLALKKVCGAQ